MRRVIFSLVVAFAVAGAARAQESAIAAMVQMHQDGQPVQLDKARDPYTEAMLALKAKLQRQTKADGGQLTAEHQASIQKELEALNQRYGKTARR